LRLKKNFSPLITQSFVFNKYVNKTFKSITDIHWNIYFEHKTLTFWNTKRPVFHIPPSLSEKNRNGFASLHIDKLSRVLSSQTWVLSWCLQQIILCLLCLKCCSALNKALSSAESVETYP
jgi:hypothetical protein